LKFHVRRDKNPKKRHLLRILPHESGYLLQPDWDRDGLKLVKDVDEIYKTFSDLLIEREDVE
jgi:hypothetical protein